VFIVGARAAMQSCERRNPKPLGSSKETIERRRDQLGDSLFGRALYIIGEYNYSSRNRARARMVNASVTLELVSPLDLLITPSDKSIIHRPRTADNRLS